MTYTLKLNEDFTNMTRYPINDPYYLRELQSGLSLAINELAVDLDVPLKQDHYLNQIFLSITHLIIMGLMHFLNPMKAYVVPSRIFLFFGLLHTILNSYATRYSYFDSEWHVLDIKVPITHKELPLIYAPTFYEKLIKLRTNILERIGRLICIGTKPTDGIENNIAIGRIETLSVKLDRKVNIDKIDLLFITRGYKSSRSIDIGSIVGSDLHVINMVLQEFLHEAITEEFELAKKAIISSYKEDKLKRE